jgi:hypothetical protein
MKHPSNRELFDYWNEQRGSRLAPERDEIDPHAIRRVLADMFILSFEPVAFRFASPARAYARCLAASLRTWLFSICGRSKAAAR